MRHARVAYAGAIHDAAPHPAGLRLAEHMMQVGALGLAEDVALQALEQGRRGGGPQAIGRVDGVRPSRAPVASPWRPAGQPGPW